MKKINFFENANPNITNTLNSVSSTWTIDQIIRFLYKELAIYVQRDLKYYLQTEEEKLNQFSQGFINRFPMVVCYTISEFYCSAFQEFGIDSYVVQANSSTIPLYGVVVKGELGDYFLNPLEDLLFNQYGLMPKAFGYIPRFKTINSSYHNLVKLDSSYLSSLDESLGFSYLDKYFDDLRKKMIEYKQACLLLGVDFSTSNKDIREEKLAYFCKHLINKGNVKGPFERALLYQFLNETLMDRRERRYVKVLINDGLSQQPYISYKILKSTGNITYYEEHTTNGYTLKKHVS